MSTSLDPEHGWPQLDPPCFMDHRHFRVAVKLDRDRDRDRMLVCPTGDVDLATADTLESRIVGVLHDSGSERIVVDLRAVTFIDSSGSGLS